MFTSTRPGPTCTNSLPIFRRHLEAGIRQCQVPARYETRNGRTQSGWSVMVGQMLQNSTTCIFIFNDFYLCSTRYTHIQHFLFIFNNAYFLSTSTKITSLLMRTRDLIASSARSASREMTNSIVRELAGLSH